MRLACCSCACKAPRNGSAFSCSPVPLSPARRVSSLAFDPLRRSTVPRAAASSSEGPQQPAGSSGAADPTFDSVALPENFCIIESPESVKDFAALQLDEIEKNIAARRNKIFLLMEEVRRLRIQLRLRGVRDEEVADSLAQEEYPSSIPFFPPINEKTIKAYTRLYAVTVVGIITFGGLVAPMLEVRLGVGGSSYFEFIQSLHLPTQLAQVDPIVASFCGGGVGVLTALLIVEANNAKMQEKRRCIYCQGTGYLTCGTCVGVGALGAEGGMCANCAGTGKVMCTSCLCTGKKLATEHDPRVDPFTLGME